MESATFGRSERDHTTPDGAQDATGRANKQTSGGATEWVQRHRTIIDTHGLGGHGDRPPKQRTIGFTQGEGFGFSEI